MTRRLATRQRSPRVSHPVHKVRRRHRPALEILEHRVMLSTFTVNSTGDSGNGSGATGDLRYCITQANGNSQANTIVFDSTVFGGHQTIALGGTELELKDTAGTQTIIGPAAGVTIDAGGKSSVLKVDTSVTASLSGLTITGGSVSGKGDGGGVNNDGHLTLTRCTVSGNSAGYGGGVFDYGTATLTDCTIVGNSAGAGGGVLDVALADTVTLTNCTVSGNSAGTGGGVWIYDGSTLTIGDTIVAGNTGGAAPDIAGPVTTDLGYNLIDASDGSSGLTAAGDEVGTAASPIDAELAPLGDYGGPTQTMALLPGSPAIDTGIAVAGVTTDQRGVSRPLGTVPDIGAFESRGFTIAVAGGDNQSTLVNTAFTAPLAVTVTSPYGEPVAGGVVTFAAGPAANGASATLASATATIDAAGQASVTATANATGGHYTVAATASGATGTSLNLTNLPATPITITPGTMAPATAGSLSSQTLAASGGAGGPYTFNLTAGAVPAGFNLSTQGTLSGTNTIAQTDSFTVTVTDSGGFSASQEYSLTIDPAPASQLVIATQPAGPAVVGEPLPTQPVVYFEDQYKNLETSDSTTTVTAGLSGGAGPLLGTTSVTVSRGKATFAGLADAHAETLTLAFTSGTLSRAVSSW